MNKACNFPNCDCPPDAIGDVYCAPLTNDQIAELVVKHGIQGHTESLFAFARECARIACTKAVAA
jgi:hypothetical protein